MQAVESSYRHFILRLEMASLYPPTKERRGIPFRSPKTILIFLLLHGSLQTQPMAQIVLATTVPNNQSPVQTSAIWRSEDRGQTWSKIKEIVGFFEQIVATPGSLG
jgi:hypothetical protein